MLNLLALLRRCWPSFRRSEATLRLLDGHLRRRGKVKPCLEALEDRTVPAAVLTATLDDQTSVAVQPGDTIHYLVTVSNTGDADATGTALAITLDPNAPEPGANNSTLRIGPLARRDTFSAVGNTPLSVNAAGGLRANDFDIDGLTPTASLAVTAETKATSAGGSVTINADGSFTYTPQTGDQNLADTFTYTLTDGDGLVGTGTVTINLGERVWYVDSAAPSAGADGSFNHPFTSLTPLNNSASDVDDANDTIFVYDRGTAYTTGITLEAGQSLFGDGFAFTANGMNIGASNNNTQLTTSGITLASGNTVKRFTISGTTGAAITGSSVASGTFDTLSISTPGAAGVSLATATGTFTFGTGVSVTGGASGAAFDVSGGSANITYSGNITQASNNALVNVTGGNTGTITFQTGTLSATAGTGLQFNNADGTYNFNGTATLNGGNAGIDITNGSGGTFSFGSNPPITHP